jgi:hypothetical protein
MKSESPGRTRGTGHVPHTIINRITNLMRYTPFLILILLAGCMSGPPVTGTVRTAGFPDVRIVVPQGAAPPTGTTRCFKSGWTRMYCFSVLFDDSYNKYCNAQLEANGITSVIATVRQMRYVDEEYEPGYVPSPDRVNVTFLIENTTQGTNSMLQFDYMLPKSSQKLGRTSGFRDFARREQMQICVESVTADMEGITQELVQKLKGGTEGENQKKKD